jgi:hypothetical protein
VDAKLDDIVSTDEPSFINATSPGTETSAGQRYRTRKQTPLACSMSFGESNQFSVDAHTGEVLEVYSLDMEGKVGALTSADVAKLRVAASHRPWHLPAAVGTGVVGISLLGWGIHRRRKVKASTPAP